MLNPHYPSGVCRWPMCDVPECRLCAAIAARLAVRLPWPSSSVQSVPSGLLEPSVAKKALETIRR